MRVAFHLPLLVLAVLAVGSCSPKAGGTCESDACGDEHTLLACKHNRFMPLPCDGPKGCKVDKGAPRCDFSGNKLGTACDERFNAIRMCKDGKSVVGCTDGKFSVNSCAGPAGCTSNGDADGFAKDCDATVAKEGDTCDRNFIKSPACDANAPQLLQCDKSNKFVFYEHCRGPKGCTSENGAAVCDHSVQQEHDPCTPPVPEVCSTDGAAMLLCDGYNMFERPCVGAHGCWMKDGQPLCDQLPPKVGGPCAEKGQHRCQKPAADDKNDHGKLLVCNGSKYTQEKRCAVECVFTRPSTYACK